MWASRFLLGNHNCGPGSFWKMRSIGDVHKNQGPSNCPNTRVSTQNHILTIPSLEPLDILHVGTLDTQGKTRSILWQVCPRALDFGGAPRPGVEEEVVCLSP